MDVSLEPERIEELTSRGILSVPVVIVGDKHAFGYDLEAVAALVGVHHQSGAMLAPDVLARRFGRVLAVATHLVSLMPADLLSRRAIPNRDRPVVGLAFHTIDLCPKLLVGYPTLTLEKSTHQQRPDSLDSGEKLAAFGREAQARLGNWWEAEGDNFDPDRTWDTYYGPRTSHQALERQVWHSAQHTRQLYDVVVSAGLTPEDGLTDADLEGLPLPSGLWE